MVCLRVKTSMNGDNGRKHTLRLVPATAPAPRVRAACTTNAETDAEADAKSDAEADADANAHAEPGGTIVAAVPGACG